MRSGKLSRLLADPRRPGLLKGEVWISPDVLAAAGFEAGPRGLAGFASALGADVCFFHWPAAAPAIDVTDLAAIAREAGLAWALTIDGPFQRLTARRNLLDILQAVGRDLSGFRSLLDREMETIKEVVDSIRELEIELLVIGDDLGYAGGLYFSPAVFRTCFLPLYEVLVQELSGRGIALGWHSDGDVEPLLPDLVACGFRFFFLEPECVDLPGFKQTYGSRVSLVGGIRVDWLAAREFNPEMQAACRREISALAAAGGLILASSCGLYSPQFLPNLKKIYQLVEEMAPV